MQPNELKEPIHLTQPNEKPRPNFYRQQFFEYNGNLKEFTKHLANIWRHLGTTMELLTPGTRKQLEQYFTPGDIEKNARCHNLIMKGEKNVAPGENIIKKWSACDLWLTRKPSFLNCRQEELNQFMLQEDLETSKQIYTLQKKARLLNLQDLVDGLETKSINGTQAQAKGQLNKSLQDAENRDKGQVKDINQSNIQADVNAATENINTTSHEIPDDLYEVLNNAFNRERETSN